MSIVTAEDLISNESPHSPQCARECFYCGKRMKPPFVHWMGTSWIYLHPKCVDKLVIRLHRDILEIEGVKFV